MKLENGQVPGIRKREILNPKCRCCQIFVRISGGWQEMDR
jgi:hypothetical protein